jgi:pimeloyl-ACP methyl ester carboxylesterase
MVHYYDYGEDQLAYFDEGPNEHHNQGNDKTENTKAVILLLHGFGEDHGIWQSQITFLSKYFRVIAPNLPGVHCKPLNIHPTHAPNLVNYVEVMHELMHSLHIDKYYVLGHSMGGYIGLAFADYYVNHVIGLGLIHSTTFEDSVAKKESRLKVAEFIEEHGTRKFLETSTQNLFGNAFKQAHPDKVQDVMDSVSDLSREAMIQFVMAMRNRKAYTHLLTQQRIPVWMIVGEQDIAVPIEDSLQQTQLLPPNNVMILENVGHMGMLEASEQVNSALLRFINEAVVNYH